MDIDFKKIEVRAYVWGGGLGGNVPLGSYQW